jgi:hypothetical protein
MATRMTTAEKRNKVAEEYVLSLYKQKQMPTEIERQVCSVCEFRCRDCICETEYWTTECWKNWEMKKINCHNLMEWEIENEFDNDSEWWFKKFCNCIDIEEFCEYLKTKNKTTQQLFNRKKFDDYYNCYAEEYFEKWLEERFEKNYIQVFMDFVGYSEFSLK